MPLSPKDFQFVNAPQAPAYGPKPTDFSWLSNLVPDYYKAQLAPLELAQKQIELRQYQDFYGGGGSGGQPSATAQPSSNVAAAQPSAAPVAGGDTASLLKDAIYGQESSHGRNISTSQTGNIGPMQISKSLFRQYAQPGEDIYEPGANKRVGDRILDDYLRKYNGDWSRAAVAYYSGEGNVAPAGSSTPWKVDKSPRPGVAGPSTSGYVRQIGARMRGGVPTQVATAAAPSGFGADATATAGPPGVDVSVSKYDPNLTPEQAARAGLTPAQVAADRATVAANAPTGVSTAAPAPEEPIATGGTSPPFAPARVAAAAPQTNTGPAGIQLASIAPSVAGLTSAPPSSVVPTSSAEVAGTQGQGIGTRPSGIGPGPMPAANVAGRFPGAGEQLAKGQLAALIPPPPAPQPSATPAGRDNLSQGAATSTAATTRAPTQVAQAEQNIPDPRTDPDLRRLDAQIQNNLGNRLRQAPAGGFLGPMLQNRINQLDLDLKNLQQRYEDRFNQINTERQRMLGSQSSVKEAEQKRQGEYLDNVARDATNVGRNAAQLDQIAALGRQAPSGTGALVQQWLGSYGIPTKGLSEIQSYQRAIDLLAPQLAGTGESAAKASEIADFRNALGGLLTTPEGRELAVANLQAMQQYKASAGRIALDDRLTNGEKMRQLAELPFPRLQTEIPKPEGASAPIKTEPGKKYKWTPQGGLVPQ
jgi:hypothetical protein